MMVRNSQAFAASRLLEVIVSEETHSIESDWNQHRGLMSFPVHTEWWPMPQSTRKLKALSQVWTSDSHSDVDEWSEFGDQMFNIYAARQGLQPFPELVVAFIDEYPVGLLAGRFDFINQQFFIDGTALHPTRTTPETAFSVLSALVDAAVDASLAQGWRGWVAYDAEHAPHRELLSLGFSATHPLYYRKMGYFS
jgi:hypothetical protein